MNSKEERAGLRAPITGLFVMASLGNFMLVPIADANQGGALIAMALTGAAGAQVAMVSAWIVFAPFGIGKRVLIGVGSGILLFSSLTMGLLAYVAGRDEDIKDIVLFIRNAACVLPLMSLAVQTPLWCVRIGFRWYAVGPSGSRVHDEAPLALRDMFVATAAVAVVFALVRLVHVPPFEPMMFVMQAIIYAGIFMLVSAATTLPLTLVILRSRNPEQGCMVTLTVHVFILFVLIFILAVNIGGDPPGELFMFPLTLVGAFLGTQVLVLFVARSNGIKIVTPTQGLSGENNESPSEPITSLPDSDA